MKCRLLFIFCFGVTLVNNISNAQTRSEDKYATRYRLDLPEEWIKKPRIIKAITNILPQTLSQIEEFDFCTQGKARYVVRLLIAKPMVKGEVTTQPIEILGKIIYTHFFEYSFYAGLLLCDTNGKAISLLRLNGSEEAYSYKKEYSFYKPLEQNLPKDLLANPEANMARMTDLPIAQNMANQAVNERTASAILTIDFLEKICVDKIFEIQKIVRQIASAPVN